MSRWRFRGAIHPDKLFLVVTRQDPAWSDVSDQDEPYALCAVLDDRERAEANLYAEVQALLRARVRVRVQP